MIAYEAGFRALVAALGAPVAAWAVGALVARTGSAALSNTAIISSLLTPAGLAAASLWTLGYLVGQLLLGAGLMTLAALALAGRRVTLGRALGMATRSSLRLLRFGVKQLVALALIFAPFLGLAGLTYGLLLAGHDINYYLVERPPAFLAACDGRSDNVARAGDRRSVRKRGAHGLTHGLGIRMRGSLPPSRSLAVRSMGVHRHGDLGRDPPSRPRRRPGQAPRLP
jgi:hypothetical protein